MTHIQFNCSGKEYNFALPINTNSVQRTEVITNDKLFIVSVEMTKNIINVYEVSEEFFEANTLVHTQPIKKAVVRATAFVDWYLSDMDTFYDLMQDAKMYLGRKGKISLTAFDLFKNCGYIPEDICVNIMEDANASDEYDSEEILFLDDYQDEPKYYML